MNLLSYWEALALVRSLVPPVVLEQVALSEALGRVLAEPVTARCDLPPFDNSAVDGYALLDSDVRAKRTRYRVGMEARAGDRPLREAWAGRLEFVPAAWECPGRTRVRPLGPKGSHRLDGAARADVLILDQERVDKGETVTATHWDRRLA
ncbi:MAG: hypothetical protein KIS66_14495 [Fimbriimonadaceae bacterium]|nr:hypothetical protein [Fimbriimonadaceae bacterium]